ncbi:unnamed protein product [Acanthoscelides obtectus]|uniref:Cilia- and flagella-associated protein 97 n=1 Tax=Acanthoscelides obtectus TaxID=200917 RepID=A0A9P0PPI3_ACAOB|nr:unnamed protein product [Acanthoscelides obtectus]CAK1658144.1 Cilia- and flagella-associated protein 97 [Acanthoscelides obtectus]
MDDLTSKLNNCDTCDCIQNGFLANVREETGSACGESNREGEENESSGNDGVNEEEYLNDSFEEDDDVSDYYEPTPSEIQRVSRSSTEIRYFPNKTFSSEALREIERNNKILMRKIVSNTKRKNQYIAPPKCAPVKLSSAAINRRRLNEKIARDNQILLRKIQNAKPCLHHK